MHPALVIPPPQGGDPSTITYIYLPGNFSIIDFTSPNFLRHLSESVAVIPSSSLSPISLPYFSHISLLVPSPLKLSILREEGGVYLVHILQVHIFPFMCRFRPPFGDDLNSSNRKLSSSKLFTLWTLPLWSGRSSTPDIYDTRDSCSGVMGMHLHGLLILFLSQFTSPLIFHMDYVTPLTPLLLDTHHILILLLTITP